MKFQAYEFKNILNVQSIIQQYYAKGITDIEVILKDLDSYTNNERKRLMNDAYRANSRKTIIKNKTVKGQIQERNSKIIANSSLCPDCRKYHLIQLTDEFGAKFIQCVDLSKGSPKAGCGYSRMRK